MLSNNTIEIIRTITRHANGSTRAKSNKTEAFRSQMSVFDSLFVKRMPVWKRTIDIIISLLVFIVLLPILLIIGIFIKTVSPGPILFRQQRVGCGGAVFYLYKFRTMKQNADTKIHKQYLSQLLKSSQKSCSTGNPMMKLNQDAKIIKYGHFLRASGLDELPQLFNVLLGQMSLVGPRPPIPYEVEHYPLWYKGRFDVMPGLTGLWQTSGKNKLGFNEMMRLDIEYAMKRSFWLDCKILLKTPMAIYTQLKVMNNGNN